jgi:Zn-finger nucleic acid-binding protein
MIQKPSEQEQEYFQRQELERLKKQREQASKAILEAEKTKLKDLHFMHCPKCGMEMNEVEFRDVMIDACFCCGGMYLDKGEIDKILAHQETGNFRKIRSFLFGSKEEDD